VSQAECCWRTFGIVAVLLNLVGCLDPCGNRILSEIPAQVGSKRAVVFERDCGATTDFNTQVSILNANESAPREAGNVFIADSDHGAVTNLIVSVRWDSPDHLVVVFPARARVFQQQVQVIGVNISYEKAP
jgi:hypothetical protein